MSKLWRRFFKKHGFIGGFKKYGNPEVTPWGIPFINYGLENIPWDKIDLSGFEQLKRNTEIPTNKPNE